MHAAETSSPSDGNPEIPPGAVSALLRELAAAPDSSELRDWQRELRSGERVGRFQLLRTIGRGGFGVVYEAQDTVLGRKVALKAVRTGGRSALRQERLQQEAEAAARLSHPNIVTLFDLGRCDDGPYLVLELLEGEPLAARIERGSVAPAEAVRIAIDVARGLAHAHRRGVIHRDLTPGNVFLCAEGPAKVLDFGLAHAFGHDRVAGGTPAYMAPEQWAGAPEDERTDVYALGVLLYRMLTGALPFPADVRGSARSRQAAPRLQAPEMPALVTLVAAMLESDPARRPRDGAAVLAELERQAPPPGGAVSRAPAPRARGVRLAVGAALAALILAAGAAFHLLRERLARDEGARPVVVVADLVNGTGDSDLDALSGLLITSLEQSRRLSVLTRARMADLARQIGAVEGDRVDELLGREICRRSAARALLLGAVHKLGDVYTLELRALDPARESYLFAHRDQAGSKEALLDAIDRISEAVRRDLREPDGEVAAARAKVAEVVTPSLEAYRHYALGRGHLSGLRFAEAAAELRRALVIDPGFALALFELARMGRVGELTPLEREAYAAQALRHVDRLPPRERRILQAWSAMRSGRYDEWERLYRGLAADYPDDKEVALELGSALAGQDRPAEAVPFLERAQALDPGSLAVAGELQQALGWLGRVDRMLELARSGRSVFPGPQASVIEAGALLWAGQWAEAARLSREGLEAGEKEGGASLREALIRGRDFEGAEREAHRRLALTDRGWRQSGRLLLAVAHASRGLAARAAEEVRLSATGEPGRYPAWESRWRLAVLVGLERPVELRREAELLLRLDGAMAATAAAPVAWRGDLATAALLARDLPQGSPEAALYRAAVDWRSGRREIALPVLARLATTHSSGSMLDVLFYGEAALESGHPEEAYRALSRFATLGIPLRWAGWAYPSAELGRARAKEALGHREEARRIADDLSRLWRAADPGYAPAAELRTLLERLAR